MNEYGLKSTHTIRRYIGVIGCPFNGWLRLRSKAGRAGGNSSHSFRCGSLGTRHFQFPILIFPNNKGWELYSISICISDLGCNSCYAMPFAPTVLTIEQVKLPQGESPRTRNSPVRNPQAQHHSFHFTHFLYFWWISITFCTSS
jgi:hypothetical protein